MKRTVDSGQIARIARLEEARDAILRGLGWIASILIVIFVLLFFAGALDPGPDIIVTTDQRQMQTSAVPQEK
jgi:hypothetical protein